MSEETTFYFPDTPALPLPPGHRFPATKYSMLLDRVRGERVLGTAVLAASPAIEGGQLELAHAREYVAAVLEGRLTREQQRRIGLPWSETLVARSLATVGGTLAAARQALAAGISGQLSGGTHHARRCGGSGFCVFNDLAVAALVLIDERRAARVAILDLDVHQGDGTADILAANPAVLTISVHGANNFPFDKVPSDIDVALPDGTGDEAYLTVLEPVLASLGEFEPDLVLYLAGVDGLAGDRYGRLALSHAGLMARDRRVLSLCRRRGWPVSIAIGGGYAEPIEASVEAYVNTFRSAREVFGL